MDARTIEIDEILFTRHPVYYNYYASTDGKIYSAISDRVLNLSYNLAGYKQVSIRHDGRGITKGVHVIVWEVYRGLIPAGREIDHINHIRDDNRLENLRVVTKTANRYNKLNNTAERVDDLPEDAFEVKWYKDYNFINYWYSPSTESFYRWNDDDAEVYKLKPSPSGVMVFHDINGLRHGFKYSCMKTVMNELADEDDDE